MSIIKCISFLCLLSSLSYGEGASHQLNACAYHIAQHERLKSIPRHLLTAIAKMESGRLNPHSKRLEAWPWTINVQGQGYFFTTKAEAIKRVKKLQAQGITSIDVGCMQINLHHHKQAFTSLEQAFDPKTNVDYGAKFLASLRQTHGSWTRAVAHYHSATPAFHIPYRKKVLDLWRQENRVMAEADTVIRGAFWAKLRSPVVDNQWQRYHKRLAPPNRNVRSHLIKGQRRSSTPIININHEKRQVNNTLSKPVITVRPLKSSQAP